MAGGLIQLISYGAQDIYLTGNPQITFFKMVYRRHTNFAIEVIERPFIGDKSFNSINSITFDREGDLINKMYLRVILNTVDPLGSNFAWVKRIGHFIVRQLDLQMGGTIVDRQYGVWLDIWYELARQGDHERGYNIMIGDVPSLTAYNSNIKPEYTLYVPLQFYFNKHIGLSVPMIALQYHKVVINLNIEKLEKLIITDSSFDITIPTIKDISMLINYVYLDSDERRRFAQVGHEYLIDQIQHNGLERVQDPTFSYKLDYNHPNKELFWAMQNGNYTTRQAFPYYTNEETWDPVNAADKIIRESISVGTDPTAQVGGNWTEVHSGTFTTVGTFNITNHGVTSIWMNPTSLLVIANDYGITDKILADITINVDNSIVIDNIETILTVRDLSIATSKMTDTRFGAVDPLVNIPGNYGVLIDGTSNPVQFGVLLLNGHVRFDRREGIYFNHVQPDQHHTNNPKDGINVYSFALYPEQHQPSGSANLSRIASTVLTLMFADQTASPDLPDLNLFNPDNIMWIFGLNNNIIRVLSGLVGLAYNL